MFLPLRGSFGRVTLAAALLTLAACGGGENPALETLSAAETSVPAALIGGWYLDHLVKTGQAPVSVTEAERFSVAFEADGRLRLRADCNSCGSRFAAAAGSLEIEPLACTRAYCPSAPLDTDFAALVGEAVAWSVDGAKLTLRAPAGVVVLRR